MSTKPKVFVIRPFEEEFHELYKELKKHFVNDFEFIDAKDLDNQRNILRDIVEGIAESDVILADLTGLNANVFYEMGLAHAMNKKVIIITQAIDELPFDIKAYRANQYSISFYKIPLLLEELDKLLKGAIDESIKYGNPVSDYVKDDISLPKLAMENNSKVGDIIETYEEYDEQGYLDYITEINDDSDKMSKEIFSISSEMKEMVLSIENATNEINGEKIKTRSLNPAFVRNVCRKLSIPIGEYATKLEKHITNISIYWNRVENNYLGLLDNSIIKQSKNLDELKTSGKALIRMKSAIENSDLQINSLIGAMQTSKGVEKKLNQSIDALTIQLQNYITMIGTISSSIDRIISKNKIVIAEIEGEN